MSVTLEFAEMLKKEYDKGMSIKDLNIKYHTDVNYVFKKYNIQKRDKKEILEWRMKYRPGRYKLNWTAEGINNEKEAYIIGMLLADGCIIGNQVSLKLSKKDIQILTDIKNYISKDIQILQNENTCCFKVSSVIFCNNIKKLGLNSRKTNSEFKIPEMDKSLYRHFIRGYFDGDGTIFKTKKGNYYYLKSNICSPTKTILEDIQNILVLNNIDSSINKEKRVGKTMKIIDHNSICTMDMYRLYIRKKEAILKFYNFLYDNSEIFLKRKYDIFRNNLDLLENKKHVNTELI